MRSGILSNVANTPVTNFRLPVGLRELVRELAAERGMTLTDATVEALTDWVRKQERKKR